MDKNNMRVLNFLKASKYIYLLAYIILIAGIFSLFYHKGFKLGVDFIGGNELRVAFNERFLASRQTLESALSKNDLKVSLTELQAQQGSKNQEFFMYYQDSKQTNKVNLVKTFDKEFKKENWSILSESFVGPKIGKQFQKIAFYATIMTLIGTLIYIALRFQLGFGMAALVSLIHTIFLLLCFISFLDISFDIPVLAAILTIIGYSLNDTVVIFDRIRSETLLFGKPANLPEYKHLINLGISRSLVRTFLIIITILVVLFIMYFLGSTVLKPMTVVLIIGVIIGVIATNFLAPPILYFWHKKVLTQAKNKD